MSRFPDHGARPTACFEVLPLGKSEEEARRLPEAAWLTVTCSPRYGPDLTVEVAGRLRALGHQVTPHIAARMIRDQAHLDRLLGELSRADIHDLFVIAGDAAAVAGEFTSAVELLPRIAEHPQRPTTIGIAAYPEGHPLIDDLTLVRALEAKSRYADYATTQMCFDPGRLLDWLRDMRGRGFALPVLFGLPGVVDRRRLLEISMRIGVGPSLSFVRKQRGIRNLLRRPATEADRLYDALAPAIHDTALNAAGFHLYTFNQLCDTWQWEREKRDRLALAAES
jgi:methylenetetrahydrofolate reductase (NADPH)